MSLNRGKVQSVLMSITLLVLASLIALAGGEDFELKFEREVPSKAALPILAKNLEEIGLWPHWFYGLEEASLLKADPSPALAVGRELRLRFNPHKGPNRLYSIDVRVDQFQPGKLLGLRVLDDSKHKLSPLFDPLRWEVEIRPGLQGPTIIGRAFARTAHWRSRLFGRIADQVLMNQAYYPDLFALSKVGTDEAAPESVFDAPPEPHAK